MPAGAATQDLWQQGFVPGRNFNGNPVSMDAIARKASYQKNYHNIPIFSCFDFASAFPPLLHSFILWLFGASGAPPWIMNFIENCYKWCIAHLPSKTGLRFFLLVRSGIIQGCPLSGAIFGHCSHPLFAALKFFLAAETGEDYSSLENQSNICQGCADDIGGTLSQLRILKTAYLPMTMMQYSAGLTLNATKCVFVPLCPFSSTIVFKIRRWLSENVPLWCKSVVSDRVKYLGFMMGPKYISRVSSIAQAAFSSTPATFAYN